MYATPQQNRNTDHKHGARATARVLAWEEQVMQRRLSPTVRAVAPTGTVGALPAALVAASCNAHTAASKPVVASRSTRTA
jgi:hypothetical protein